MNPEDARTVLDADDANRRSSKRVVQKAAEKKPLSKRERSELEGVATPKPLPPKAPEQPKKRGNGRSAEKDLAVIARRRRVYRMRMEHPPVPIREIANLLDVDTKTVMSDLKALRASFAKADIARENIEALGKSIAELEILAGEALADMKRYTAAGDRAMLARTALAALKERNQILMDVGIITKVPDKIELSGETKTTVEHTGEVTHNHINVDKVDEKLREVMRAEMELENAGIIPPSRQPHDS